MVRFGAEFWQKGAVSASMLLLLLLLRPVTNCYGVTVVTIVTVVMRSLNG